MAGINKIKTIFMDRFSFLRISAVLFLSLFLSSACIMDWAPIIVSVTVQDKDGKSYRMEIPTKVYMPRFSGLELLNQREGGRWFLRFGEFDGSQNHNDTFTLKWPDGTQDVITFHRTIMTPLIVVDAWRLNVKKVDQLPIVIVK